METGVWRGLSCVALAVTLSCSGAPVTSPAAPIASGAAVRRAGHYANVHGLRMYYEDDGPPTATKTIVILHGGTGWVEFWLEPIELFAKDYRVIVPEQMGHGRTADDPTRPFHYHDMAEDTVELLRQLHVDRAFVLGWSDGGIVGLDLAINHPGLVTKLAIAGANFDTSGLEPDSLAWVRDVKPEDWPFRDAYVRLSPDGAAHFPQLLARLKTMWLAEPNFTHQQLAQITSPTLIVVGDHDMIRIEHTIELFKTIPGARLWIVPDSDHGAPKEHAPLFDQTVGDFFAETPAVHP